MDREVVEVGPDRIGRADGRVPHHLGDLLALGRRQDLVGLLVDQGISDPKAIGVTGISLGGGGTANAAFLNDQIRQSDGTYIPWKSPGGTPLSIAAAWPRWQWSDLADSLVPNGRFRDDRLSTIGLGAIPAGLMKQSFVTGLYATSLLSAYISPPGVDRR